MAAYAGVPVVNALTDDFHPCQLLADLQTVQEHLGALAGRAGRLRRRRRLQHGQLLGAGRCHRRHARRGRCARRATSPTPTSSQRAARSSPTDRRLRRDRHATRSPPSPARRSSSPTPGSRWAARRRPPTGSRLFAPYAADRRAARARRRPTRSCCTACPPTAARRSSAEVIDGPQSVVWDEAENRRHAQKAILAWLLEQAGLRAAAVSPTTKSARHQRIIDLVTHHDVRSQTELAELLRPQRRPRHPGHAAAATSSSSTRSRSAAPPAPLVYAVPAEGGDRGPGRTRESGRGHRAAGAAVRRAARSAPTPAPTSSCCAPRPAPPSSWPAPSTRPTCGDVLGTIAGDDTVLVIGRDAARRRRARRAASSSSPTSTTSANPRRTTSVSKVLTSLPVGERVGIAFSGGLDTSVAVAWMRDKGAVPCTYTADIGQYDEPDIAGVPGRALAVRRRDRPRRRLQAVSWSRRAWPPWPAARSTSAPAAAPTSTPRRSVAPSPARCWCARCTRTASTSGATARPSRATTSSGSTATACSPTPTLRIYKPWLDADFVARARRPRRDEPVAHRARPALPRQQGEGLLHRRQHLGRHPRGQDPRAPRRLAGDRRADHGREVLGPLRRDRDRGRHGPLRRRAARSPINGTSLRRPGRSWCTRPTTIGGRHGLGMSDQIENRIIEAKSRGIYEAPGMALLWIAYERLLNAIHNEDTIANYHDEGRRLGRLLYEGRWLDPQALMMRESIQRWIASLVTGEVTLRLRRGEDYTVLAHRRPGVLLPPRQAVDGAHRERRLRSRPTASASSPCATSTSPTRAPSSSCTPASRRTRATCWSRTATSSASSSPAAPTASRDATAPTELDDEALDTRRDGGRDRLMADAEHAPTRARSGAGASRAGRRRSSRRCRGRPTSTGGSRSTTSPARTRTPRRWPRPAC